MKRQGLFRILLRLLPFDLRSDYGADIEQVFGDQRREARGPAGRACVWVRTVAGLARVGPREHLAQLRQDAAYAWRDMRRHPGFVAVVVLTLAAGIGINTAIFSVVHAVLLQPLPYARPDELVALWNHWTGAPAAALSDPEYLDYSERSRTLSIAAAAGAFVNVAGGTGDPDRVPAAYVTANALQVLGVRPAIGRGFRPEEENKAHGDVAILAGTGLILGLGLALLLAGPIGPLLFDVSPRDAGVIAAVSIALVAVAFAATWLPVRRATRIDPVVALRVE